MYLDTVSQVSNDVLSKTHGRIHIPSTGLCENVAVLVKLVGNGKKRLMELPAMLSNLANQSRSLGP